MASLLHLGRKDLHEIYKTPKEQADTSDAVKQKLSVYFKPKESDTYKRYKFRDSKSERRESSVNYITRLKSLVTTCDFQDDTINDEIRDQFIFTCQSVKLKKFLLQEENLSLDKMTEIARNKELSDKQATEIADTLNETERVLANNHYKKPGESRT